MVGCGGLLARSPMREHFKQIHHRHKTIPIDIGTVRLPAPGIQHKQQITGIDRLIMIDICWTNWRRNITRVTYTGRALTKPLAAEVLTVWLLGQQALIFKRQAARRTECLAQDGD